MPIDMSYLAYTGTAPQTTVGQEQEVVRDMALANPAERTAIAANVGGGFSGAYGSESPLGYEGADDKSAISTNQIGNYPSSSQNAITGGGATTAPISSVQPQSAGYTPVVQRFTTPTNSSDAITQYGNLGLATAGTAGFALDLAGKAFGSNFLSSIGGTLGKAGTVGSVLLNAYRIASGDVKGGAIGLGQTAVTSGIVKAGTKSGTAALTSALGSTGSTLGSLAAGVSAAMPWYAAAKLGGVAINAVTANNPEMKGTHIDLIGHGLEEPLDVEGGTANWLADKGIGSYEGNRAIASAANPIGGLMKDVQSGNYSNIPNTLLSGSIGQSALVGSSAIAPIAAGAMAAALPVIAPLLPFAGLISGLFGNDADDPIDALGRAAVNNMQMPYIEHQWEIAKWKQEQAEKQQALNANNPQYQRAMSGMF